MLTIEEFLVRAPEFESAAEELVQGMLDEAAAELTQAGDWGGVLNTAHRLLTADKLWRSPFGATIRLDGGDSDKPSRYAEELKLLHRKTFPAVLVL
jgi:hypothetical protein